MADRIRGAATSNAAGTLILILTAIFSVIGVDLARDALDETRLDRETYLSAIGLGLNREETLNLLAIAAIVILVVCTLTAVLGVGVLLRRESVRHAAVSSFVVLALVTLPLAISGMLREDPARGAWIGFAIGVTDAVIVYLLLHTQTITDFERAEGARERARAARRAERRARRSRATLSG
jgi:hypothetical protein